jgi:hypothetical protein
VTYKIDGGDVSRSIITSLAAREGIFNAKELDNKQRQMVWDLFKKMQSQGRQDTPLINFYTDAWKPILDKLERGHKKTHRHSSWIGCSIKGLLNFLGLRTSSGALCELARAVNQPLNPSKGSEWVPPFLKSSTVPNLLSESDAPAPVNSFSSPPIHRPGFSLAQPEGEEAVAGSLQPTSFLSESSMPTSSALSSCPPFVPPEGDAFFGNEDEDVTPATPPPPPLHAASLCAAQLEGIRSRLVTLINKETLKAPDITQFEQISEELLTTKSPFKRDIDRSVFVQKIVSAKSQMLESFNTSKSIEQKVLRHRLAKSFMKLCISLIDGVFDVAKPKVHSSEELLELFKEEIDTTIFKSAFVTFRYTEGVQKDIQEDSREKNTRFVYTADSNFNGAQALDRSLSKPGYAVRAYTKRMLHQRPQAHLAFSPDQVEAINVAAHIGWNGLVNVLDQKTHTTVNFGYFAPTEQEQSTIVEQLLEKGSLIEYPVVTSIPKEGSYPVTIVLVAAPALSIPFLKKSSLQDDETLSKIQFLCAFNAFSAQFNACLEIAHMNPDKSKMQPIKLKVAPVGFGPCGNKPSNIAQAFYAAYKIHQEELRSNYVHVEFQVLKNSRGEVDVNAMEVVRRLGLTAGTPRSK